MVDITIEPEDDDTYTVLQDGQPVASGLGREMADGVCGLLARCVTGDEGACGELDRLGIDPPALELDRGPLPCL